MFATASDDGPTRSSVDPPDIDAAGGFADWAIGAMAAHEDLAIALDRGRSRAGRRLARAVSP
jgi:hypothetical protein